MVNALCDLNDLLSVGQAHNLSNTPLKRLIQTVEPRAGTNGIASYVYLWSHFGTIMCPLVQHGYEVCKMLLIDGLMHAYMHQRGYV